MVLTSLTPTGVAATFTPGTNVPRASIDGGGFSVVWIDDPALCSNNYGLIPSSGRYGNVLILGSGSTAAIMTPQDAAAIDQKMDDGIPNSGAVRAPGTGSYPNCIATSTTYNLSYTNKACMLIFLTNL